MSEMKSLTLNDVRYDGFVDPVARALAGASAVIKPASGERITLPDSSGNKLYGLNIYGKTTQNGTPTPDAPVELMGGVDQGGVTVTLVGEENSQSLVVEIPAGLFGIPVPTGGNYTDASGQQWICDEINFEKGVYSQRIGKAVVTNWKLSSGFAAGGSELFEGDVKAVGATIAGYEHRAMCNKFTVVASVVSREVQAFCIGYNTIYARVPGVTDVSEFNSLVGSAEVLYALNQPIETPLTEEEIATYNSLRTHRGTTTVTNDAGVYMELEYAMDAKTYIDSLFAKSVARLTNVTLPASAWTGSGSLYSQVVTIAGVTQYSKVDLLPSVEQLAEFYEKDITFVTENDGGVITVYVIGQKPTNDYTIQANIVEVLV